MTAPPLHGLLLAGGRSRRMGQDKAQLSLNGGPTLRDRSARLLDGVTNAVFLSVAPGDTRQYEQTTLPDLAPDRGPLAGLEAAFHHAPDHAWLVVACDLPLLDDATLGALVGGRHPSRPATAFTSRFDGRPEPLCAIYEPAAADALQSYLAAGQHCARHFLESLDPAVVELPNPRALDNCNRPEDLAEAAAIAQHGAVAKTVTVEFFAQLRDQAGCPSEPRHTTAATAAGLWEEVRMHHRFALDLESVRAAVNDRIVPWATPLNDGDQVAFMPPFSGG